MQWKLQLVISDPILSKTKENQKDCLIVHAKTMIPQIIFITKDEGPNSISHVLVK